MRGRGRQRVVQGRDKATETEGDVRYTTLALFFEVWRMKNSFRKHHKRHMQHCRVSSESLELPGHVQAGEISASI